MSHSVSVVVSPCVVCEYLGSLKSQYQQIAMNYPAYLAKIESMLCHAVLHNLEADSVSLLAMWASEKDSLSTLKSEAFTAWAASYFTLYTPPVIPEEEPEP